MPRSARRLYEDIQRFQTMLKNHEDGQKVFAALEESLLFSLLRCLGGWDLTPGKRC